MDRWNHELIVVLVSSGLTDKIPQTGCLLSNRHLFLPIQGAGKSKVREPTWSGSGEDPVSVAAS